MRREYRFGGVLSVERRGVCHQDGTKSRGLPPCQALVGEGVLSCIRATGGIGAELLIPVAGLEDRRPDLQSSSQQSAFPPASASSAFFSSTIKRWPKSVQVTPGSFSKRPSKLSSA